MKKRIFALFFIAILAVSFCACSNSDTEKVEATPTPPPDLTGEWKQTNSNSDESWQSATITADTIEVYWVTDNGDTKSLYWAGTFIAPTESGNPYSWDSENDHEKTDLALLASGDNTKYFTYDDGELSYSVTAMGTTMTVRLAKQ